MKLGFGYGNNEKRLNRKLVYLITDLIQFADLDEYPYVDSRQPYVALCCGSLDASFCVPSLNCAGLRRRGLARVVCRRRPN